MNNQEKPDSRAALLCAAQKLFVEKGYEAVGTRELAEEAGVNLGAIQYHFGSKGQLFVETMKTLMEGEWPVHVYALLDGDNSSPRTAAVRFSRFIRAFLQDLLLSEEPQPCRMMVRELFTPTSNDTQMFEALVSTVTENFIRPVDSKMLTVFKAIAPGHPQADYGFAVHSAFALCLFYLTHGPFIERLRSVNIRDKGYLDGAANRITQGILRHLRCEESFINEVLREAARSEVD